MMALSPPAPRADEPLPDSIDAARHDAETIRAAQAGDSRAFERIVQGNHTRVFSFLLQMTRHRADAEDLTQQTFVKAYHHLDRVDAERPIIPWLLTIARNNALNHFRSKKKWEHMPVELEAHEPTPARQAELQESADNIWSRARRVLSPREFEVLWLRFAEELSTSEAARVMGLTQIHLKVLVHRARQKLLKGEITP